ncbi:MAG TPA: hypothetical protein VN782_13995 [Usitatibacter sp.]|nr:hypothetical protein [Usitatibacter sp.]
MATIVSIQPSARRRVPGCAWLRRLDELGPVLLLAAVLAVVAVAAHEWRPGAAAPLAFGELHAE